MTVLIAMAAIGLVLLAGTQAEGGTLLKDLFVPLPPSSAKVKQPLRHPPPPKEEKIVIVQEETIKPPDVDWAGMYQGLPRDSKGVVDWMRALNEQTITPKAGLDDSAEPASTKDSEIEFTHQDNPGKPVVFRHATHTQWLGCKNCHSAIFKKKEDNLQFTHDEMDKGLYCGACHGKVVVVPGACKGCHAKKAAA
jgi:c(7)-type cytochrome triheme protein